MPDLSRQAKGIYGKNNTKLPSPGPWLGIVTNHLDPTYMGALEVSLIQAAQGTTDLQSQTFVVNYVSPFAGTTSIEFEGTNSAKFQDSQQSYGFWAVPPDIGTTVMVIFIDGDPNSGFWFGCVPDRFQNHMIPGIAASTNVAIDPTQERKYGTRYLPVGEFNKSTRKDTNGTGGQSIRLVNEFNKPVHPFADRLLSQGLLLDKVRGVTSSGARREVPSSVFGISTPGPLDTTPNGKKRQVGYTNDKTGPIPVTRLGGSSFVMDDGDKEGQNELVRIRTRTGHQILMHNSSDLIYIGNSKGTAWIELTSNGKIDVYAEDSVSIHTENDFNFKAERDINLEAGRDMNFKVSGSYQMDVTGDYTLLVQQSGMITFSEYYDHSVGKDLKLTVGEDGHIAAGGKMYTTSIGDMHIRTGNVMHQTSAGTFNVLAGGKHIETATEIHMNGPAATSATAASAADIPEALPLFLLPNRAKDAGWENGQFYKAADIESIMKRVPTHEPWDHHESLNPGQFTPAQTDIGKAVPTKTGSKDPNTQPTPGTTPDQPPNLNRGDMPADWTQDADFIKKVRSVAASLGCSYIDLLCCMAFETGRTFNPAIQNSIGATGLIQFIRPTAIALGTTTDALAAMSRTEQMDWVLKYFKAGPVSKIAAPSLEDLYMQILWPRAVGKPLDYILFTAGEKAYAQNPLDKDKKGYVTKADAARKVRDQLNYVRTQLLKVPDAGGGVTDSSGNPITDGSGNPVKYGGG